MKTQIGLFISLSWLSGVLSSNQFVQSDPAMIKPGDSHTMTCQGSGGFIFGGGWMCWVRQFSDGKLQWLLYINSNGGTGYNDVVKGRATATRDNSNNKLTLKMDNMKIEDTGVYYCGREGTISGTRFDIWGPGTVVTVTSAQPSAPSVFPLLPCCDSFSSLSEVTIGCLSTGYLPAPVDVTWNSGSITTGIRNLPDVLSRNGNYLSTSLLTISTSDWKNNKYTCTVDHKATGAKISKDIPECTPDEPIPPTVEVLQGSCGETGSVDLVCLISGYSPEQIKIQWLLNGKETAIFPTNSTPYKDSEGKFESRSQVSVPKEDWNSGDTYTCRVNHPPSSSKKEDSIHKCSESSTSHPKVVILPPSPKELLVTKEAKVTCIVEKLTSTDSTEFKWKRDDGNRLRVFTFEPEEGFDGTYTVKSVLKINVADWYSGKQFSCTVSHSDLPAPVEKKIAYRDEDVTEPTIYCFHPSPEELAVYDFVGLTCILKQFSHRDLYVQWKKNGVVIDENNYTNTEPVLDGDGETYVMFSTALISKSEWNRGATYTCSGVLKQITSREIKKNRGK